MILVSKYLNLMEQTSNTLIETVALRSAKAAQEAGHHNTHFQKINPLTLHLSQQ